ncbi:hypothetical protein MACK_003900 [Theileria orientalis]|uniref:Uncharacterized protein n=1 Tax=Theileria orientalis TaxID=68886 RepID=A0A976XJ82_THEOR|nr:hypothetical protein MACK_003900 [Theileria orientalis]
MRRRAGMLFNLNRNMLHNKEVLFHSHKHRWVLECCISNRGIFNQKELDRLSLTKTDTCQRQSLRNRNKEFSLDSGFEVVDRGKGSKGQPRSPMPPKAVADHPGSHQAVPMGPQHGKQGPGYPIVTEDANQSVSLWKHQDLNLSQWDISNAPILVPRKYKLSFNCTMTAWISFKTLEQPDLHTPCYCHLQSQSNLQ